MLVICLGPDSFRARHKYNFLFSAYKNKYQNALIEEVDTGFWSLTMSKLVNSSLFSSKKMLAGEGLLEKFTAKDLSRLEKKLKLDNNETVVLDYEEKLNKTKLNLLSKIDKKYLKIYEYKNLNTWELKKEVTELVQKYNLDFKYVDYLIDRFQGDLWAIDTELQVLRLGMNEISDLDLKNKDIYVLLDMLLKNDRQAWKNIDFFLLNEDLSSRLVTQIRNWFLAQEKNKSLHPYVLKKMQYLHLNNSGDFLRKYLKLLYATRNGLLGIKEVDVLL